MAQIPIVDYLVLGNNPHLVASECTSCGARFFDRRNACANCSSTDFKKVDVATEGELQAYTIVSFAAPGVPVPFVAAVIDCDGTSVRANVINTPGVIPADGSINFVSTGQLAVRGFTLRMYGYFDDSLFSQERSLHTTAR